MANIKLGDDVYVGVTSIKMNTEDGGLAVFNLAPLSVLELQRRYEFSYYSTMNKAVTDVNNGTTANSDAEKGTAVAGVYTDENGGKNVVLLKDYTEAARIQPSVDMTINLGGHTLSADNVVCINVLGGNLVIDGRLKGSALIQNQASNAVCVQINTSSSAKSLTMKGGTYEATAGTGKAYGVNATSRSAEINIENCDIEALSNYYGEGGNFTVYSCGITSYGTLTLNNCHIMGTHSGVSSVGTATVNGGVYEGYGHGGFYLSGADTPYYVRDAIIRDCEMPDGYTATENRNGAGFYLGDATNVTVYMDNCDIYGIAASQIFVIKTNDNALYISNSTINNQNGGAANVRIDSGNTLYLGRGNNFTAENTSLPEAVVVTDEVYRSAV